MSEDSRKVGLIADLARARREIGQNAHGLAHDLDFTRRFKTVFQKHRAGWLAGGGVLGFLLAELPARGKKIIVQRAGRKADTEEKVVKAGLLMTIAKILFDIVRPALTKSLTRLVATYAAERLRRR